MSDHRDELAATAATWLAALLAGTMGALAVTAASGGVVPTALVVAVWVVLALVGVAALVVVAVAVWVDHRHLPDVDDAPLSRLDEFDGLHQ